MYLATRTRRQSKEHSTVQSFLIFNCVPNVSNSRQAAKHAHPDKGGSETKMAALNEAYKVLSTPELRSQFDSGVDPNDPMAQQGGHPFANGFGGGHPFASFFQHSGGAQGFPGGFPGGQGGPFQFHFSQHGR